MQRTQRSLLLAGACLLAASATALSQSAASAGQKPCPARQAALSPGDIAASHGDYAKAAELYGAEAKASGPEGERAHAAQIHALLHSNRVKEADDASKAWAAAAPTSPWSGVAVADVQWREGLITEAGKTIQTISHLDACNARIHYETARYFRFNRLMAAAKNEIEQAHAIDPVDDDIENAWINLQPRGTQLAELTRYLERSTFLSEKERKHLEAEKVKLSQPAGESCKVAMTGQSTTIQMRALQDGPNSDVTWGLNVMFEGKQKRMEIDTGAHGLLLTKAAATALHLAPDEHFAAMGVGDQGGTTTTISKVQSIKVGDLEFKNCDVEVLDNDKVEVMGEDNQIHYVKRLGDLDGLIGGDVFKDFLLTLDFPGHVMKLDPLPSIPGAAAQAATLDTGTNSVSDAPPQNRFVDPSMKDWSRVYSVGNELIMPVHLNNGPLKLFLVDTGAGLDSISPDAAREVANLSSTSNIDVYGVSGKVKKVYTTGPIDLNFAGLRKQLGGMTAFDTTGISRGDGVEISGFLGGPTLQQLTLKIDYRDMLVDFSYDPKRVIHCAAGINIAGCF